MRIIAKIVKWVVFPIDSTIIKAGRMTAPKLGSLLRHVAIRSGEKEEDQVPWFAGVGQVVGVIASIFILVSFWEPLAPSFLHWERSIILQNLSNLEQSKGLSSLCLLAVHLVLPFLAIVAWPIGLLVLFMILSCLAMLILFCIDSLARLFIKLYWVSGGKCRKDRDHDRK